MILVLAVTASLSILAIGSLWCGYFSGCPTTRLPTVFPGDSLPFVHGLICIALVLLVAALVVEITRTSARKRDC